MQLFRFATVCLLALAATACVATSSNGAAQAGSDQWRLQSLEESFLNFKEKQRIQEDQTVQMRHDLENRIQEVERELAAMRSQLADMNRAPAMAQPAPSAPSAAAPSAPPAPAPVPRASAPVAQSGEDRPWANVPGQTSTEAAGPAAAYREGLQLVLADKPAQGRQKLQAFLERYPNSSLVPNALYWIGESYYSEKNYGQAILSFREVVNRFPQHSKAPAALLKMGMSYEMSGDTQNAVLYLRALVDDYPDSDPAGIARQRLRDLPE